MTINVAVWLQGRTGAQFWDTGAPARNGGFPSSRNYRFLLRIREITITGQLELQTAYDLSNSSVLMLPITVIERLYSETPLRVGTPYSCQYCLL